MDLVYKKIMTILMLKCLVMAAFSYCLISDSHFSTFGY